MRVPLLCVLVAGLACLTCEPVPLTAPVGSEIFLQANPSFVAANGGRSLVTALVVEPAGTLVPDGTEVRFLTTLGQIDASARTRDGVARVYFVADAHSGTATVTATSGGPGQAPAPSPSASPNAGKQPNAAAREIATAEASVDIRIGSALPTRLELGAEPVRITGSRWARIIASVYDEFGNPVQNVPVIFRITGQSGGGPLPTPAPTPTPTPGPRPTPTPLPTPTAAPPQQGFFESLDSGGAPQFTDSNGQAFDTLRTTAVPGAQRIIIIEATTANGLRNDTLRVFID